MVTLEEYNKAVDEACDLYREFRPSWNVGMACSPVADDYGMNDTEYELMYNDVEFFCGKRK